MKAAGGIDRSAKPGRDRRRGRKRAARLLLLTVAAILALDLILPPRLAHRFAARPLINLYRTVSGLVHEHDCPSHPSCSAYALAAYEKHGLILGTLLTVDRLLGEPARMEEGPWVWIEGRKYVDDPLSANTFWWP